jgi:hypothetical protein
MYRMFYAVLLGCIHVNCIKLEYILYIHTCSSTWLLKWYQVGVSYMMLPRDDWRRTERRKTHGGPFACIRKLGGACVTVSEAFRIYRRFDGEGIVHGDMCAVFQIIMRGNRVRLTLSDTKNSLVFKFQAFVVWKQFGVALRSETDETKSCTSDFKKINLRNKFGAECWKNAVNRWLYIWHVVTMYAMRLASLHGPLAEYAVLSRQELQGDENSYKDRTAQM